MNIITLTILLIVLAAISKVVMDLSSEGRFNHKFWDKDKGWTLKYRLALKFGKRFGLKRMWEWLFKNPFVFITDGWHLSQLFFLSFLQLAIAIHFTPTIWWFLGIKLTFSTAFQLPYGLYKKLRQPG